VTKNKKFYNSDTLKEVDILLKRPNLLTPERWEENRFEKFNFPAKT
jgi:hypothetical protein